VWLTRRQSKTYHWLAFIGAQIASEIPYLILCATLYFACWYFTAGFPVDAKISGHIYLQMICTSTTPSPEIPPFPPTRS
jgi:ABC-type multidrug transport system permease subunit